MDGLAPGSFVLSRQHRLRDLMATQRLDFLLVSNPKNIFYLTGFRGSTGIAVLGLDRAGLFVDPRYTLQAREQSEGVDVHEVRGPLLSAAGQWLTRRRARNVGYDDAHMTCSGFNELQRRVTRATLKVSGGIVEDLRLVKDSCEIDCIRQAGQITAAVFSEIRGTLRPGLRESDLTAEIEYRMRLRGAEGAAFETIVASGKRSAWPHARASSKLLKKDELVIFDLGAILQGYAADMTRTVFLGRPAQQIRRLYAAVLIAQEQAVKAVRPAIACGNVDSVARRALSGRALDRYFTHSTGHGVGLDIHERPRLARKENTLLEPGCVVTVEPGVYIEGLGGVRIEDTVLVTETGGEILTPVSKEDWIIS
jgi:Xaa-Pro aminopeptidase